MSALSCVRRAQPKVSTPRIAPKLAHVRSKNTRAPLRLSYIARAEYSRSAPSPRLVRVASPTLRTSVAHPPIVAPKSFIRMYAAAEAGERVIKVPNMGDSITSGVLLEYRKKVGDYVNADDLVALIETDKVSVEVRAPESGTIVRLLAKENDTVEVGADLFVIQPGAASGSAPAPSKPEAAPAPPKPEPAPAQPKPEPAPAQPKPEPAPAPKAQPTPAPEVKTGPTVVTTLGARTERRVRMTQMRKRIAQRLKDSQNTAAMLTTFNEIDMHNVIQMREKFKDAFAEKHKVKLGFMSIFCKASAQALMEQPIINAVIDGDDIVYRDYVDISVAVATPTGLVVPVLRNVEKMGFADIEKAIMDYSVKAREGRLQLEDMAGGTFTVSNGGVYGSMMGTPIINPPQSAILGMHAVQKRPYVVNDQIVIRPIMYVALTYDHRLIDGRDAVTFLRRIKTYVENPYTLLLDV